MKKENFRLIARLDIKGPNLIKSVNLEGLRIVGNPNERALDYYLNGIDEIVYMDCVASLYGRNTLTGIIQDTAKNVFVPITVGGGVRTIQDAREILRSGADKIAVNTAAVLDPKLIKMLSHEFGSQCVVISIEAKRSNSDGWEVLVENGRERTGRSVIDWARECESLGAGEILLTSVDKEGTFQGFDEELNNKVSSAVDIPVIASGGMGRVQDVIELERNSQVRGVAMAGVLHYNKLSLLEIREQLIAAEVNVRKNA